jgi:hypothetical protein
MEALAGLLFAAGAAAPGVVRLKRLKNLSSYIGRHFPL